MLHVILQKVVKLFQHISKEDNPKEPTACQRKKPSQSSCMLARELFGDPFHNKLDDACAYQTRREFCKLHQVKYRRALRTS